MMYSKRLLILLFVLCSVFLLAVAGCGGDDDDVGGDGGVDATTAPAAGDEIEVLMGEDARGNYFDPDEITVAAGTTVTFTTINEGAAIHNMRIAGPDNRYNTEDDAANEDYVSPGDSASFTWDVPSEPGTYKFQCDIHPVDMVGTVTVE